jgi:hypothetical protein
MAAFQFVAQRFAKAAHGKFACGVSGLPRRRDQPEDARQIHDVRARLAPEQRQKILDAVNRAPKIDFHEPAKVLERNFFKVPVQRDARIVDEQRDPPVALLDVGGKSFYLLLLRDVDRMSCDQGAGSHEVLRGLLQGGFVHIGQRQRAPRGRQLLGERPANPRAGSGYDRDTAAQKRHTRTSSPGSVYHAAKEFATVFLL